MQHVVYQNDMALVDIHRQIGRLDLGVHADAREIIAVKRDIERA